MDEALKKKIMGALAAGAAAFMFGGSQIMDLNERLTALEEIHPELKQAELDEVAEELKEETPAVSNPPEDADHLELNENDEWVPVEESSEEPVEEVIEETEED
jgi:uncharacterized protein HemX